MIFDEYKEIAEQCKDCARIMTQPSLLIEIPDRKLCCAYLDPESKWRNGKRCPLAPVLKQEKEVKHVDPIKKSKRSMGK